jgi:hypothetical protein
LLAGTGLPGAFAGATAIAALTSVLGELGARLLGHREKVRVGAAARFASRAYDERIASGDQLRDDGWFDEQPRGRSAAAEIFEGSLLNAQREHEERKIEYLGYLLANLSFEANVDQSLANWVLRMAEQLTWTQLVLLAMIGRKADFVLPDITIGSDIDQWQPWGLHQQLADLGYAHRELILAARDAGEASREARSLIPVFNMRLRDMELRGGGVLLYHLMWIDRIPRTDIEQAIEHMQPSAQKPLSTQ